MVFFWRVVPSVGGEAADGRPLDPSRTDFCHPLDGLRTQAFVGGEATNFAWAQVSNRIFLKRSFRQRRHSGTQKKFWIQCSIEKPKLSLLILHILYKLVYNYNQYWLVKFAMVNALPESILVVLFPRHLNDQKFEF